MNWLRSLIGLKRSHNALSKQWRSSLRSRPGLEGLETRFLLATGITRDTRLAFPLDRTATLVAGMVQGATAAAAASPDDIGRGRLRPAPLHP